MRRCHERLPELRRERVRLFAGRRGVHLRRVDLRWVTRASTTPKDANKAYHAGVHMEIDVPFDPTSQSSSSRRYPPQTTEPQPQAPVAGE